MGSQDQHREWKEEVIMTRCIRCRMVTQGEPDHVCDPLDLFVQDQLSGIKLGTYAEIERYEAAAAERRRRRELGQALELITEVDTEDDHERE
jgi:hypothetical protein